MRRKLAPLLALALAAAALGGCGGGGDSTAEIDGHPVIEFETDPDGALEFTRDETTGVAGNVKLVLHNPQPLAHVVAVENSKGNIVAETRTVIEDTMVGPAYLNPGTFTYFCTVPGYREEGMEGTLTIEPRD